MFAIIRVVSGGEMCIRDRVAAVFQLNGLFNVLIRHGNYISVYCNLSSASVKSGDTVSTKQFAAHAKKDAIHVRWRPLRGSVK